MVDWSKSKEFQSFKVREIEKIEKYPCLTIYIIYAEWSHEGAQFPREMKMISFSFILWAFNAIKWQALSTSHSFSFAQFLREKLQLSQLKWSIGQWHCQLLTRVVHQRKHYCPSFLSIVSLALVSFPNLFLKTSNCANPWFRGTRTKTLTVKTYLWHWDGGPSA